MKNLKIGHHTNETNGTGVTVFLFDYPARGAYVLCGSSPASHEVMTLDLESNVSFIDGLAFLGGSAFGLTAVDGVMRWCKENHRGHRTSSGVVPIVPAVGIYDLTVNLPNPPTEKECYLACQSASESNQEQGRIGVGFGATVGKCVPHAKRMTGGIGRHATKLEDGLEVIAYAVVNSVGDVLNKNGAIIAGAKLPNGDYANCEEYLLKGHDPNAMVANGNTTLVSVFTNARFSKIELKRIAKVAISGMARSISPVFTRYDGDILFCISLGELTASECVVSAIAADAVRNAIINAVNNSTVVET